MRRRPQNSTNFLIVEAVALIVQIQLQQNRTDLALKEVTAARRWAQDSLLVNLAESWVGLRVVCLTLPAIMRLSSVDWRYRAAKSTSKLSMCMRRWLRLRLHLPLGAWSHRPFANYNWGGSRSRKLPWTRQLPRILTTWRESSTELSWTLSQERIPRSI